jgi:cation transport regulator ChaB
MPVVSAEEREKKNAARAARRAERPGRGLAKFLKEWYDQQGWSRSEAAHRGRISEGYLCHLFAGDVQLPRADLFRSLVEGWGFNPLRLFKAAGYISDQDIENTIREYQMDRQSPSKPNRRLVNIVDQVMSLPEVDQDMILASFSNTLSMYKQALDRRPEPPKKTAAPRASTRTREAVGV